VNSSIAAQVVFDEPTLSPPPQPPAPAVVDELGIAEPAMAPPLQPLRGPEPRSSRSGEGES